MDNLPTIATICSHSALQIFHGAKQEGFSTMGICNPEREKLYRSFPHASPDKFLTVDSFSEIVTSENQKTLLDNDCILIPHGSFVEYVGPDRILHQLKVPIYGNKDTLKWESDRTKERKWLERSGVELPREFDSPEDVDQLAIVKFSGAKGGKGFFLIDSGEAFLEKIEDEQAKDWTIQQWIKGTRYYPHYFYSLIEERLEILGIDRRDESNVDEYYRWGRGEKSFVVVGNRPLAVRESLLPRMYQMGRDVVDTSRQLFEPGLFGPFCLEMVCTDELSLIVFEISGRIVAGTNLYPQGSPYSYYYFDQPMSTGRRIAREIKLAWDKGMLDRITT